MISATTSLIFEDGCRLGLVPFDQVKSLLASIIGAPFSEEKTGKDPFHESKVRDAKGNGYQQTTCRVLYCIRRKEEKMLNGSFDSALTTLIPSAKELDVIIELSIEKIYQSKQVLEREAGGHEVIDHLMEAFVMAAYTYKFEETKPKHASTLRLLPEEFAVQLNDQLSVYETLQIIIDFISGLTDSHAVRLYQTIKGFRLPV